MKSVLIYGPQGCGKTINADKIAKHFGLKRIVDAGRDSNQASECLAPKSEGTLYLTTEAPKKSVSATVMSYEAAAHALGLKNKPTPTVVREKEEELVHATNQLVLLLQIYRGTYTIEVHPGTYVRDIAVLHNTGLVTKVNDRYEVTPAGHDRVQLALNDEVPKNAAPEAKPKKGKRKLAEAVLKSFVTTHLRDQRCRFCSQLQTDGDHHTAECIVLYARSVVDKADRK